VALREGFAVFESNQPCDLIAPALDFAGDLLQELAPSFAGLLPPGPEGRVCVFNRLRHSIPSGGRDAGKGLASGGVGDEIGCFRRDPFIIQIERAGLHFKFIQFQRHCRA
jgi:hypothetical protein